MVSDAGDGATAADAPAPADSRMENDTSEGSSVATADATGADSAASNAATTSPINTMNLGLCGSGCGKPATMACPTCVKLDVKPMSYFCTQECFKLFWPKHKGVHKEFKAKAKAAAAAARPPAWTNTFEFTGPLRPAAYGPKRIAGASIPKPDYAISSIPVSERLDKATNASPKVYTPDQIANIREACQIGRIALDAIGDAIKVGVTTDELDRVCHEVHLAHGAYPSPLNYYKFPKSVCTSVNEVICHGIPDCRPLEDGDIVNIDVSTYYKGCHGDLNETFLVGNVDEAGRALVKCAFGCLAAALDEVRKGTMYRDLGKVISKHASATGHSVVRTYCGHGIGELFHTAPNVPHYAKNKAKGVMAPGHIFTVEPMINEGKWQDVTWPDNWTAVTIDGLRSAQFEHTVLITERTEENPKGYEILTMRKDEPVMVWTDDKFQR